MTISFEDLEATIVAQDLIGVNIHYRPEEETWNVWTRKRDSDGWSISGQTDTLEEAVKAVVGPSEANTDDDGWEDLI